VYVDWLTHNVIYAVSEVSLNASDFNPHALFIHNNKKIYDLAIVAILYVLQKKLINPLLPVLQLKIVHP